MWATYAGPEGEGQIDEDHAVLLVGYNNTGEFWIAKNSWGTSFADGGFFRVKFGVANTIAMDSTFGLTFTPFNSKPVSIRVTADPDYSECVLYRVRACL
jgi:Papain family cysteine protease